MGKAFPFFVYQKSVHKPLKRKIKQILPAITMNL